MKPLKGQTRRRLYSSRRSFHQINNTTRGVGDVGGVTSDLFCSFQPAGCREKMLLQAFIYYEISVVLIVSIESSIVALFECI